MLLDTLGAKVFVYSYHCDACNLRLVASYGQPGFYHFSDGDRMPASTVPAWCHTCETITLAENIPSLENLLARLERLKNGDLSADELEFIAELKEDVDDHIQSCIQRCQMMIGRFAARRSGNRCIECGNHDFVILTDSQGNMPETIQHHHCVGRLRLEEWQIGSPATFFLLDADGNRISAAVT